MVFNKPEIPGLFLEFAPGTEIDLIEAKGLFAHEEAVKHVGTGAMRLLTKEELHYLCAAQLLKAGETSFWGSTPFWSPNNPASHDFWYFAGQWGFVTTSNKRNALGLRYINLPQ